MKWLLGLPGVGYLYVAPEVLAEAPVLDVGYLGLDTTLGVWPVDEMPAILPDGRRYELGMPSLPALAACTAGIELLIDVGIDDDLRAVRAARDAGAGGPRASAAATS